MIHGMWGGPWHWTAYRDVFESAGYRCVAVTLPFHDMEPRGIPDPRLATASLLDYAAAIEREIKRLGEKPIVMGHSLGGLLAQMLAARGLARALVLIAPASPAGILPITPTVIRSFWRIGTTWAFWRKPVRPAFADVSYALLHRFPEAERRKLYERFVYESGRAIFEIGFWPLDSRRAANVDASKVDCPVLVLAGAQDRITPASVVRKVARRYQAVATYKEYDGLAHWLVGEPGWEEVAAYALAWLERNRDAGGKR
ncbi:alpha/beta hydrolase [Sulfurifustis variabilis]|uniref:Alpha/beta hydrolase n=2 Tax=Sulfurifustis variabilis TaxID=1675686 RepID=A0A1B4V767_9GAMM|nr:alpha/beta hydrolase [Sulfurifustis variabilis]